MNLRDIQMTHSDSLNIFRSFVEGLNTHRINHFFCFFPFPNFNLGFSFIFGVLFSVFLLTSLFFNFLFLALSNFLCYLLFCIAFLLIFLSLGISFTSISSSEPWGSTKCSFFTSGSYFTFLLLNLGISLPFSFGADDAGLTLYFTGRVFIKSRTHSK